MRADREPARAKRRGRLSGARRAGEEAAKVVPVTDQLSEHARAIESILDFTRNVVSQTKLSALNAIIEAARAGNAGRGFAVVAGEVKSLAGQTARATDDIVAKIAAIQGATARMAAANADIRSIVADVQASAYRVREAMERQAGTTVDITAAVDETAMAAGGISSTMADIRSDTERVACDIDAVQRSFAEMDAEVHSLRTSAEQLAKCMSA